MKRSGLLPCWQRLRVWRARHWLRKPAVIEGLDQLDEFEGSRWLEEVIVGAKQAGPLHVFGARGGGEHTDWQRFEAGLLANPFQDFEAGFLRHVDVQEDQGGERVAPTVGKGGLAGEVLDGLLAVGHGVKRMGQPGTFEGELKEEDIVGLVFRVEDASPGPGLMDYWIIGFGHWIVRAELLGSLS